MLGFSPAEACFISSVLRSARGCPVRIQRRQGCTLELDGEIAARVRARCSFSGGTGSGRYSREACRLVMASWRVIAEAGWVESFRRALGEVILSKYS